MFKKNLFILILTTILWASNDGEDPRDPEYMIADAKQVLPVSVPGKAILVILRPNRTNENDENSFYYLNESLIGVLQGGTYFIDTVSPGTYNFLTRSDDDGNINKISLEAGKVSFVLTYVWTGRSFTGFEIYNESVPVSYTVFKGEYPFMKCFRFDKANVEEKMKTAKKRDYNNWIDEMDSKSEITQRFSKYQGFKISPNTSNTQTSFYDKRTLKFKSGTKQLDSPLEDNTIYIDNIPLSGNDVTRLLCHNVMHIDDIHTTSIGKEITIYNKFVSNLPDSLTEIYPVEDIVNNTIDKSNADSDQVNSTTIEKTADTIAESQLDTTISQIDSTNNKEMVSADSTQLTAVSESTSKPADTVNSNNITIVENNSVSESATQPEEIPLENNEKSQNWRGKSHILGIGVGLGIGMLISESESDDFNKYIDDIIDTNDYDLTDNSLFLSSSDNKLSFMYHVGAHMLVRPIPWFSIGLNYRFASASKSYSNSSYSYYSSYGDTDLKFSLIDQSLGVQFIGYPTGKHTISFKAGFGIDFHNVIFTAEQENSIEIKGYGMGITPLIGLAIAPGSGHVMINLDFMLPLGKISFTETKSTLTSDDNYLVESSYSSYSSYSSTTRNKAKLPESANIDCVLFRPSVTVCFP